MNEILIALSESKLQIEHLHHMLGKQTVTGNSTIAIIERAQLTAKKLNEANILEALQMTLRALKAHVGPQNSEWIEVQEAEKAIKKATE